MKQLGSRDFLDFFAHTEDAPVKVNISGVLCSVTGIAYDASADAYVILLGHGVSATDRASGVDVYAFPDDEAFSGMKPLKPQGEG